MRQHQLPVCASAVFRCPTMPGVPLGCPTRRVLVTHHGGRQTVEEIKDDLGIGPNDLEAMHQNLIAQVSHIIYFHCRAALLPLSLIAWRIKFKGAADLASGESLTKGTCLNFFQKN